MSPPWQHYEEGEGREELDLLPTGDTNKCRPLGLSRSSGCAPWEGADSEREVMAQHRLAKLSTETSSNRLRSMTSNSNDGALASGVGGGLDTTGAVLDVDVL